MLKNDNNLEVTNITANNLSLQDIILQLAISMQCQTYLLFCKYNIAAAAVIEDKKKLQKLIERKLCIDFLVLHSSHSRLDSDRKSLILKLSSFYTFHKQ